ncbi:cytidine deaminase-like protein [Coniophora puteana RWD-64-598 SS2]|uniref:Cytidine deaminase-like protein n=1 Tax=Coniophora puteana (strain RWD-64-598) TaxID=741705 RepID=A0A5M3MAN0_CONPW|nr:cytidine deaminase-like protein [Coniophora puteana RWD-64-598 SS2]EIW75840.1 cytidine deaminase-like protein [Coniophora puteana RWD-64-598 SS2]
MSPSDTRTALDRLGLATALAKARKSYAEGGIPIGAALVFHGNDSSSASQPPPQGNEGVAALSLSSGAAVLGSAHNARIQKCSPTLHAEIAALEDAGRLGAGVYRRCTMYTTLSPCSMCTGAILLYRIPRIVIGENTNFVGGEDLLRSAGVEVVVLQDGECRELMARFIKEKPEEWNEDIGEIS